MTRFKLTASSVPEINRIEFLDYLRIFAFLSILIGHKIYPELQALASDTSSHITIRYFSEGLLPL